MSHAAGNQICCADIEAGARDTVHATASTPIACFTLMLTPWIWRRAPRRRARRRGRLLVAADPALGPPRARHRTLASRALLPHRAAPIPSLARRRPAGSEPSPDAAQAQ